LSNDLADSIENFDALESWLREISELPLRTLHNIPKDACFKQVIVRDANYGFLLSDAVAHAENKAPPTDETTAGDMAWYVDHILRKNKIDPTSTPPNPKLCFIQRKGDTVMNNLPDLLQLANDLGVKMVSRTLEGVSPLKQIHWVKSCTVLIGIHGSGLLNSMFLSHKSTVVQLMPFKLYDSGLRYKQIANLFGVRYGEWASDQFHNSEIDWSLTRSNPELKRRMTKAEASIEALSKFGAKASETDYDMDYIYDFLWRKQNLTMPSRDFRNVATHSLMKGAYPNVKDLPATLLEDASSDSNNVVGSGLHLETEGRDKMTYLKFDITSAEGMLVTDATLKMTVAKVDPKGKNVDANGKVQTITVFNEVNLGDDDEWTLGTLKDGRPHTGVHSRTLGKWQVDTSWIVSWDVTKVVRSHLLSGKKSISFTIIGDGPLTLYHSSEAEDVHQRPALHFGLMAKSPNEEL